MATAIKVCISNSFDAVCSVNSVRKAGAKEHMLALLVCHSDCKVNLFSGWLVSRPTVANVFV